MPCTICNKPVCKARGKRIGREYSKKNFSLMRFKLKLNPVARIIFEEQTLCEQVSIAKTLWGDIMKTG